MSDGLCAIAPQRERCASSVCVGFELLLAAFCRRLFHLDDQVRHGRSASKTTMSARLDESRPKVIGYRSAPLIEEFPEDLICLLIEALGSE